MRLDSPINRTVGMRVKHLREAGNFSQDDLGEALNMTGENVSKKETGKVPFTVAELYVVADFFDCNITDLLPKRVPSEDEVNDEWQLDGVPAAYYNGLPPPTQEVVREMIRGAYEAHQRAQTTHGRKAE